MGLQDLVASSGCSQVLAIYRKQMKLFKLMEGVLTGALSDYVSSMTALAIEEGIGDKLNNINENLLKFPSPSASKSLSDLSKIDCKILNQYLGGPVAVGNTSQAARQAFNRLPNRIKRVALNAITDIARDAVKTGMDVATGLIFNKISGMLANDAIAAKAAKILNTMMEIEVCLVTTCGYLTQDGSADYARMEAEGLKRAIDYATQYNIDIENKKFNTRSIMDGVASDLTTLGLPFNDVATALNTTSASFSSKIPQIPTFGKVTFPW